MEAASKRDLKEFFSDCYKGEGHPNYILRYNLEGSKLYFDVTQGGSTGSSPFFDMDLTVALYLNGLRFDFRLPVKQQNEVFVKTFGRVPDSVKIDPDYNTLIGTRDVREGVHIDNTAENIESSSRGYRLFPNPVHHELNIKPIFNTAETSSYTIKNINNAMVLEGELQPLGGSIKSEELPSGI
jgi:hypothetical protein